ncbi:hypothetical protein Tco_0486441 [Tanacetum coccineum]
MEAKISSTAAQIIASMYQTLSYVSKLSSRGSVDLATPFLRGTSYSLPPEGLATPYLPRRLATPYLLRGLATPCLLRGQATPYLLRRLATPYLLRGLDTPYLLRRHYSLVIASGPKVAPSAP